MNQVRKRVVSATATLAISLLSVSACADIVEVYLLDRLDGDLNGYCFDVNGPPHRMNLEAPIQAHTCYSYRPDPPPPTKDQAVDSEDIADGKIRLVGAGLCAQLSSAVPGSAIHLAECSDVEEQEFKLKENGEFVAVLNPDLCLTAGPVSWLGGPPGGPRSRHQIRTLRLQPCGPEAEAYQRWGTRTELAKAE